MPNKEDLRTQHAHERRQAILKAAAQVFARKGFERATTREIAQQAAIAEGTIYNYFASKDQLVVALANLVKEQDEEVISGVLAGGDARVDVTEAIEMVLALIAGNVVVIRGLVTALWDRGPRFGGYLIPGAHSWIARVAEYLEGRVSAGAIRPCDVQMVARMVMGMIVYVAMPYLQGLEPMPSAEERQRQAELLTSVLFDGLAV
jgi:AcrR family transcriptional regulator